MSSPAYKLFARRELALTKAAENARDPEWKDLWNRKLDELVQNEKVRILEGFHRHYR